MKRGLVISDLHLFAHRSEGEGLLSGIEEMMEAADIVVLNGDIFDFAWSRYRSEEESLGAAQEILQGWVEKFRGEEISYVTGNHDCLSSFCVVLDELTEKAGRFRWYRHWCRWGRSLFLHGDCANRRMDEAALVRQREKWSENHTRTKVHSALYGVVDGLGLSKGFHRWYFPREKTISRVVYHLDATIPNWREVIDDCYFGHTHRPFVDCEVDGVRFHNTGSGIRGMGFRPIRFEVVEEECPARGLCDV